MDRIKFEKGKQRQFLDLVISKLNSPSLRGILQYGFEINYSTLKNYYLEERLLPQNLFEDLCLIAKIDKGNLKCELIKGNWGMVKGGKIGRRKI